MYVLNAPRSDDESNEEKFKTLCKEVENHEQVPHEDKQKMHKICTKSDENVNERALIDNLSHSTIWNCFVEIFTKGMIAY